MRNAATGLVFLLAGLVAGCAQPARMYQWDDFQPQIYGYLKADGSAPDEQLRSMEAQAEKARAAGAALPPGFRAHLALIYLNLGRDNEARGALEAEKASFPESAHYMDFLLKRMKTARP